MRLSFYTINIIRRMYVQFHRYLKPEPQLSSAVVATLCGRLILLVKVALKSELSDD